MRTREWAGHGEGSQGTAKRLSKGKKGQGSAEKGMQASKLDRLRWAMHAKDRGVQMGE